MSGDIRSLAQRFELPRDALNSIKDMTGTYQDKLNALDAMLTKFGISQEVINAQLTTTARVFDQLASKADNAKVALGGVIATALKVPAQGIGNFFQGIADGLNNFNKYVQSNTEFDQLNAQILASSNSVDQFNSKINQLKTNASKDANMWTGGIAASLVTSKLQQMTGAQFQYAQAVRQSGASWDVVIQKVQTAAPLIQEFQQALQPRLETDGTSQGQIDQLASSLAYLSSINAFGAEQARVFANAVLDEGMSAQTAQRDIDILTQQILKAEQAKQANALISQGLSQAQRTEAETATADAINQEILKIKVDALTSSSQAAAAAMIQASGDMSAAGIAALAAAPGVDFLTAAFLRLAAAKAQAQEGKMADAKAALAPALPKSGDRNTRAIERGELDSLKSQNAKQTRQDRIDSTRELTEANRDLAYSSADEAGKVRILQDEEAALAHARDSYAVGSEAYIKAEEARVRKQIELQSAMESASKKRGGGKLSAQEKLNNQLAGNQDKYYDQVENAELKHQQNVLKIQEEYAQKQIEAQKKNEVDKRRSRYDFYSSLKDIPESDAQKYAAQYEEAFRKSQEMAQQGQQRLAKDYLDMRQKQIQELKDLESEKKDVQDNKDLNRREKEAAIRYIEDRKKLLEDAQKEEEKQLIEGGDANQKELQDRLADEDRSYADSLDRTGQRADQLADRRIAAWERANKTIAATPPAELTNLSGSAPAAEKAISAPTVSAANTTPTTTSDIFMVRDQGVIDSIGDQTSRLEGKLDALKGSVEAGLSDVSRQVGDLKNQRRSMVGPGG